MSGVKEQREAIGGAIQHASPDELDEGVCIGWVIISEWVGPDGRRWLARLDCDAINGTLPTWTREGYLWDALHSEGWNQKEEY